MRLLRSRAGTFLRVHSKTNTASFPLARVESYAVYAMTFANARNFTIQEAQFVAVESQNNIYNGNGGDTNNETSSIDPLQRLLNNSAIDATTDSSYASYAPTCLAGTREVVISDIMTWAHEDPSPPNTRQAVPIVWLSGPAGAGKTCIQRTVVELCKAEGIHAASFFFSTRLPITSSEISFIATIALQLATTIPDLKGFVVEGIERDPSVFRKSLEAQMKTLIFGPLEMLHAAKNRKPRWRDFFKNLFTKLRDKNKPKVEDSSRRNLILVDGLDECIEPKEQRHILELIHQMATHPLFPFRFILASRPEYEVRTAFSSPPLAPISRILRLEMYAADMDIQKFLESQFARLKRVHPTSKTIPVEWPAHHIATLLRKASGQFVYVSTIMKYLDNPRQNPITALEVIVNLPTASSQEAASNPFAELDVLYNKIFHPSGADIPLLKTVLHTIHIHSPLVRSRVDTSDIDALLGFEAGTTDIALTDMHSVIRFAEPDDLWSRITYHHRSAVDYITTPGRGGDIYQSKYQTSLILFPIYLNRVENNFNLMAGITHLQSSIAMFDAISPSAPWELVRSSLSQLATSLDKFMTNIILVSSQRQDKLHNQYDLVNAADVENWERCFRTVLTARNKFHKHMCIDENGESRKECLPACRRLSRIWQAKRQIQAVMKDIREDVPAKTKKIEALLET